MEKVAVAYVGRKPQAHDNVAGSGKMWNGYGDIQEVSPEQARILTRYPDQWELAEENDYDKTDQSIMQTVKLHNEEEVQVNKEELLNKPLDKMNKTDLYAFAVIKFGKLLPVELSKKQLHDEIEELLKNSD